MKADSPVENEVLSGRTLLDAAGMKQQAADQCGLAQFGNDPFAEFYDRYIDSLNQDGELNAIGVMRTEAQIVNCLKNRLQLQDWYAREPSIADEVIERPILLMGLPRSGTTVMHHLFDHDPKMRLLRMWETLSPCPPPAVDPESARLRLEAAQQMKAQILSDKKNFDAMHLLDPDGPDECTNLLDQVFGMVGVLNIAKCPTYFDWLAESADFRSVFRHHRNVLKALQWKAPRRRWVLKYPNYIMSMPELADTYPDGTFVVSHRDPVQTLASLCKLTHYLRGVRYDDADNDKHEVGEQIWNFVQTHVDNFMEYRSSDHSMPILDVAYEKLLDSPVEVVESAYVAAGEEFSVSVRKNLEDWASSNPKGKRGVNEYSFSDYGLDRARVEAGFDEYRKAFNVPREAS
jgi:Sulfotransferase family